MPEGAKLREDRGGREPGAHTEDGGARENEESAPTSGRIAVGCGIRGRQNGIWQGGRIIPCVKAPEARDGRSSFAPRIFCLWGDSARGRGPCGPCLAAENGSRCPGRE